MKKALQWLIAFSCVTAAVINILCLAGACSRSWRSAGLAMIIICYVLLFIWKKNAKDDTASDTKTDRIRGYVTAGAAYVWLVTFGMTMFG